MPTKIHRGIASEVTRISIPASATSVQLVPADVNRKGLQIYNNSSVRMYCTWGRPASITGASFVLLGSGIYESPSNYVTAGISGIWDSAAGSGICSVFV